MKYACSNAPSSAGERQWIYSMINKIPNISCIKAKGVGIVCMYVYREYCVYVIGGLYVIMYISFF